ncbi:MAG: gamma-glutamyltransferase [Candidatus Rokuibacteriota bacterium]|nr:MAG: gamma-glutamyltransferase [Candidatus Rokubacteria bacterium]
MAERVRASFRPTVIGNHYAAATGHYLATAAAMRVLDAGGNAVDAGVTAAMALAVLEPDIVSFAGVAPTLIYRREERRVVAFSGVGHWPAAVDVERLRAEGNGHVPPGILRTVVPVAPAVHIEALRRFGTISFETAARPAMELARDGFAMHPMLRHTIEHDAAGYRRFPENARIFLPGGRVPTLGERFIQADLGRSIGGMIDAERSARGDRDAKLRAAHDHFYRGPIADAIDEYHRRHDGFMRKADLASYEARLEEPIACDYRGLRVHACDTWCQGIVLLEALKILEGTRFETLGHNSTAYVHELAGALDLAFADREAYCGDPVFVRVPTAGLLSAAYAAVQRTRIDPRRAFGAMPAPGDPWPHQGEPSRARAAAVTAEASGPVPAPLDTIYACVVDRWGNAYSVTPSDNSHDTPIIPGTGLVISGRGSQGRLTAGHPAEVRPGKRPRLTPTPGLALRDGEFYFAFGTPGGDIQCQSMLQVLVNVVEFGMPVQQAIEAARFGSFNFPNSFSPHQYFPGRLCVETGIGAEAAESLRALGHDVETWPEFSWQAGAVCAILRDAETGLLHAGADPRREAYAAAW